MPAGAAGPKRGGQAKRLPLNVLDLAKMPDSEEILALDEAIERLNKQAPLAAAIVRLRFYAGLTSTKPPRRWKSRHVPSIVNGPSPARGCSTCWKNDKAPTSLFHHAIFDPMDVVQSSSRLSRDLRQARSSCPLDQRGVFVAKACGDDAKLNLAVMKLLAAQRTGGGVSRGPDDHFRTT